MGTGKNRGGSGENAECRGKCRRELMRLNQVRDEISWNELRIRESNPEKQSRNGFLQPICQNNRICEIKRRGLYENGLHLTRNELTCLAKMKTHNDFGN